MILNNFYKLSINYGSLRKYRLINSFFKYHTNEFYTYNYNYGCVLLTDPGYVKAENFITNFTAVH